MSPDSYTPKHLAERILTSKAALEGERKQVTVLFADLKGSMELLSGRDPEDARAILDPVLELMMEAVHHFEGTVNQVMGDGVMALFGAPLAHEDHAIRACNAALRMQEAVKRWAARTEHHPQATVRIRVGLNSGEVVVRSIGSDLRMDYTAVGETTHLAARMEQMATPGSVLISASAWHLVEGFFEVAPLGFRTVKGRSDSIEVFELHRATSAATRFHVATARGLTHFVGRARELDIIRDAFDRVQRGHGRVVSVVGAPGVGKSRLCWELTHDPRLSDSLVLATHAVSYGRETAWLPVIELLKRYFTLDFGDEPDTIRQKVAQRIHDLDPALEATIPALLAVLDVQGMDGTWEALAPAERRTRMLDAVARLLVRQSEVQPLILVVEDLHWIDSETQAFLDVLVGRLGTARILVLLNYRPEYQNHWTDDQHCTVLAIDTLGREQASTLLLTLLGDDPTVRALAPMLIEGTQGNPLFLEESIRSLVEMGALVGQPGAHRLVAPLGAIRMPETVQAVLAARIDRLSPEDKAVLATASVLGSEFHLALLAAIAERSDEDLRSTLARLHAADFVYETRDPANAQYAFKHAHTREVAYGSLLHHRRRALHARIVTAIEDSYRERLEEWLPALAHHAMHGHTWSKALDYCRTAGLKSARLSANVEAVAYIERALDALSHLPRGSETTALAIDLRLDLYESLWGLGTRGAMRQCLSEALSLAEDLGDQHRLASVLAALTQAHGMSDETGIGYGRRAEALAEALGDQSLQTRLSFVLGQATRFAGDYRDSVKYHERALNLLVSSGFTSRVHPAAVTFRTNFAMSLAEIGDFDRAISLAQEAYWAADDDQRPFALTDACWGMGNVRLSQGEIDLAIEQFELGYKRAQESNIPLFIPAFSAFLGYVYALAGRVSEGVPLLEKTMETINAGQTHAGFEALFTVYLAEALLLASRIERARPLAARALELSRTQHRRGFEMLALRLHGSLATHEHDPATAVAYYCEALDLSTTLGARPVVARCHFDLGSLYRRTGDESAARKHLGAAARLFAEMRMPSLDAACRAELDAL